MSVSEGPEHGMFDWRQRMDRRDRVARMAGIHRTPQTLVGVGVIGVRIVGLQDVDSHRHGFMTQGDGWIVPTLTPQWASSATVRLGGVGGRPVRHMGGFWGWPNGRGLQVPVMGSGLWQLHIHTPGRQRRLGLTPEGVMGEPPEPTEDGMVTEESRKNFMVDGEGRGPGRETFEQDWWKMIGVTGHLSLLMNSEEFSTLLGVRSGAEGGVMVGGFDVALQYARSQAEAELFWLDAGDLVGQAVVWDEGDMAADFEDSAARKAAEEREEADEEHATDMMIQHSIDGI